MNDVYVVADGHNREPRAVEGFGRIAGRRRAAIAEEFAGDHEIFLWVERLSGTDEPLITVHVCHVVRGKKDGVVACCVERAIGAVEDMGFRQNYAGLGMEVLDGVVMLEGFRGDLGMDQRDDCCEKEDH